MTEFKPTHFIEQYNTADKYKEFSTQYYFTDGLPLEYLKRHLETTKRCESIETIAIFKIQLKSSN